MIHSATQCRVSKRIERDQKCYAHGATATRVGRKVLSQQWGKDREVKKTSLDLHSEFVEHFMLTTHKGNSEKGASLKQLKRWLPTWVVLNSLTYTHILFLFFSGLVYVSY